ncbi:uncharacterized protein [Oscarella lobularis]|uniref:uncharacterized protein isoform X2 n=1 Tax=Oscarella lobularis TaxID=121494 RepID=UPI0033138A18
MALTWLLVVAGICATLFPSQILSIETEVGGVYSSDTLLTLAKSPYAVTSDLTVSKGTTLTIESGVDLNFQARVSLVVNGTLKAVASSRDRIIIMRHNATVGVDSTVLRLVDGATPREGRIEVYDASSMKWGTVCDDYWNRNNAKVVCRHLGFNDPIGSDYGTKRFGVGSGDIGLSNVDCDGVENSLLDCRAQRWNNNKCKHTEDIGVVCGDGSVGFWGGITFESEGANVTTSSYGVMDYSTSSVMQNVQILNAGIVPDTVRRSTPDANVAAIRATSAVAKMTNVTILDSRLSGIQLNNIHADINFEAVTVLNCSGTGLTGQSSRRLTCLRCHFENCAQGGISITRIPFPIGRPTVSVPSHDFSYSGSMNGDKMSYFVDDEGVYFNFTTASTNYYRILETSPGYGLSVSFDRFWINGRGCLRVMNGDTGYSHFRRCGPSSNADMTADSHQLVINFDHYWHNSGFTGDIKAYVSRHRLDSRQVNLLDCSTIRSVSSYGLRVQGPLGSLLVAGHKAIDNGHGGIQISGNGYSVQIDTSVVQYGVRDYNDNYGIYFNGYFSLMTLSKSRVSDHRYGVYLYSYGAGNMSMLNNVFNGSRTDSGMRYIYRGLYLRCYDLNTYNWRTNGRAISFEGNVVTRVGASQQSSYAMEFNVNYQYGLVSLVSVKNNVFIQNGGRFYYNQNFYQVAQSAIFSGNRFEENDVGSDSNVVELSTSNANDKGRIIVEGNTFVRNKGKSIVWLSPVAYFNSGVQVQNIVFFRNNTLKNNVVYNGTISYKTLPNCVLEVARSVNVEVYHNVFDNPGSSYDVGNAVEGTSSFDRINATLNYWGTDNELIIQNRIFDFDDSSFLATIEYFPFLLSADPSDVAGLSHPRQYPLFVTPSGEVGGQLNDSVTLTAAGSPYLITRDVTILPTGSLYIEAGVVIEVKASTGILVEGSMMSLGSSISPVTFRGQSIARGQRNNIEFRVVDGYYSGDDEYGTLQVNFDQLWRKICLPSNISRDYTSLNKLADLACKRLGYTRGYHSTRYWFPSLGTPIITKFSCPGIATDVNHCTFSSGKYSAQSRCLLVYYVNCYDLVSVYNREFGGWAGIRFSPTSTVPVSGSSHSLPSSVLRHTLIQGAGKWTTRNVPSVRAILTSPTFLNVTIRDSASTALSFEYVHEEGNITGVTVDGGRGDGISFYGPRTRNLTFHGITVRNITGSGIRMYPSSSSLPGLTNYQSICSVSAVLDVRMDKGTYFGLHQDDHLAGIYCSVELRGPPNTVLSLTLVSVQLYNDDSLVLRNGPLSSSPTIRTYSGQNTNSIDDSLLSSGNSVFVEITTGSKSSAPGFALYSVALSTKPGRPITRVNDVSMFSVGTGISFSSTNDDVFISNARVENSLNNGIYSSSHYGFYSLRNSVIRHSRSRGLYMSSLRGHIEILNNEITDSRSNGIYIYGYDRHNNGQRTRVIDSNRVSNSGNSGLYLYSYDYNQQSRFVKWNVTRNVFDSNQDGVSVYSDNSNFGVTDLTISENLFSAQTRYGLIFDRTLNAHASIDGNTFVGHRGSTGGAMLLQGTAQSLSVTRNVFHSNSGKYVVKLSPYDFTTSPFLFHNNRLLNNTVNSTELYAVDYGYPAVAVVSMSSRITMANNEFSNPETQFELGIQLPVQSSSELSVNVSRNYWGTADEAAIRDRIVDFGYCSRLANAEYFPYLTSPSGPAVSLLAFRDTSVLRPNSILRGRVSTSTTISMSGSPYTVVGDITVLPGKTLTIEAGVELRFTANTGIMVEGRLLAQGTQNLPIKFVDNSLVIRSSSSVGSSVGNIRLVGAAQHEGVAEMYYNGTWGTLCALQDDEDRFYRTSHNYYLSDVVCRELGYSQASWGWHYVNSSYPRDAWLKHLICRGSESVLAQCVNYVFERSKCHLGALHVICWTGNNNQGHLKQQQSWLHWSGVRFSQSLQHPSVMSNVFLSGAGYANAEKIAAIQVVGHRLVLTDVSVTKNAWTGVEFLNSPAPNITKLDLSLNEGTGLRLSNTLSSLLEEVTAIDNRGHGLALTSGGFLQSSWNYPIVSPLDICSQSGILSASIPFYLRYVPKLVNRNGYSYQNCRVNIEADPNHVLSFGILAIQFQYWWSHTVIDGKTVFRSGRVQSVGDSLHYVTKGNSSYVSVYAPQYYSSFDPRKDFVLIYVQQHSMASPSHWLHTVSGGHFASNFLSGIAFNSSQSTYDRSSVSIESSVISNNSWNGIDGNVTNGGNSGYGSVVRDIKIRRSTISNNGRFTTASYKDRAAGIAVSADHASIVIQNNGLTDNSGGAVSVNLDASRSESTSIDIFDNRIVRNREGGTISITGSSNSAGPRASIRSNKINHNSAGVLYDTLSINGIATSVVDNSFHNNTGRYAVYWETGQRSSISGQQFANNTLYLNVGQAPNERWTVYAVGVGPSYTGNVFTNPANRYEFAAGSDLGQGHHNAVDNWWGSRHLSEAEKRVRDKDDVLSLAAADIAPVVKESPWTDNGGCQYGWTLEDFWDFYCYLYVKGALDWASANSFCKAQGSELGSIHDASVAKFLNGLVPRSPASLTSAGAWVGLRHDGNVWSWSDGSDFDYGSANGGKAGECLKLTSAGWEIEDCSTRLPFLCSKLPADECPNACSRHGQCDRATRTCSCFKGWHGEDCNDFHCNDVNDCSVYGTCVGPNQCRCRVGWKGRACTTTYCNLYTTCDACSRQPGCGWCDSQSSCIPGLGSRPDKQQCNTWFYYSCYSPRREGCSDKIKDIGCSSPCDLSVATSSYETCQHCHDIGRCYNEAKSSCLNWDESRCPYGRVTPDYGLGANAQKIPSHLPNGESDFRDKRSSGGSSSDRRQKYVDLYPDVRVDPGNSAIYRLLGASNYNYYITTPSLKDVYTGHILSSRQSGGILDKILAMTKWGAYQLIKASPAYLEETIKYADFIDTVDLEDIYDEAAIEIFPNMTALEAIAASSTPQLPGASQTIVLSPSVSVYKCRRTSDGDIVIALSSVESEKLGLNPISNQGIVSAHGSRFFEEVESIVSAGPHTIVHTSLASCSRNPLPPPVKLQVKTTGPSPVHKAPIVTGVGGTGVKGVLMFDNVSPSGLDLSVGDVIVGRPSGPAAGVLADFYGSWDDSTTFLELNPSSGVGTSCSERDGLVSVNIGGDAPGAPRNGGNSGSYMKWCDANETMFFHHEILKTKIGNSDREVISTETLVSYDPQVEMTFRSNHTSPFVTKVGFSFKGPLHIGTSANLEILPSSKGSSSPPTVSVTAPSKPFCISIGSICVRGEAKLSASYSFSFDYDVTGPSSIFFSYLSQSRGNAELGAVWRNGVGTEYIKEAQLKGDQDLADHPQYTSTFESSLTPTFGISWPSSYKTLDHVAQSSIPAIVTSAFSASPSLYPQSSFTVEISPSLKGHFETTRCSRGCDFGKKLLSSSRAGVHQIEGMSFIDLLYYNSSQIFDSWQQASFINVTSGLCLPLTDETDCPCECPGAASCIDNGNGIKLCQPCSCSGSPGCSCTQACSAGSIEIFNSFLPQPICRCQCSDFDHADVGGDGTCQCECTCNDGTASVFGPDGQCQCGCKCNNCMDSVISPSGCVCPDDKCPACPEGLEPVWQDCTCSCQSKQGRGGLPPVCADGWKGPFCDVPDCSPWPFCSDNGICTIPMGSEADRKPYCVCDEQWIGPGCQFARPRPGGGDPHLQTLDGFSYDFFDIGEFWYCKSVANDFGVDTRFFKYARASLIGAVAIKAGPSVVAISTLHQPKPSDLPTLRLNGVVTSLSDGLRLNLAKDTVHVEVSLMSSPESIALISFQFSNGVSLSVDVRYSAAMERQFINILFAPVASFKRSTEGLCGLMDGNVTNDLVGSDGVTYAPAKVLDFAKSWKIAKSFDGSGLNGTWSWNHSNFHKDDTMDSSYTDPKFVPLYSINDIDSSTRMIAESLCKQQGLDGVRLQECIFDVSITNDTTLAQQETYQTGCPTQCSGKGRCANSTCICLPGWFGEDCNLGSCENCSLNGDCVSGFCKCHFGWDGILCDEPATCYGVSNCTSLSQGRCKSHDVCACSVEFTGSSCNEKANCSRISDCSNHGACIDHDKCKCDYGWAGVSCDRHSCETVGYCSNHGSCVGFDKCVCKDGWGGSSCAFPTCTKVGDCSGNGDCVAPNTCSCSGGFSGVDCATPTDCPELDDCSGNGVCLAQNEKKYCSCYAGYKGSNCSVTSCAGQSDCSGNGVCIEIDLCDCKKGYTGSDCSKFSCEAKEFCSHHGQCLALDTCTCDFKWKGPECNTPDCSSVNNCGNVSTGVCIGPDNCQCTAHYDGPRCDQLAGINQYSPTFNVSSVDVALPLTADIGFVVVSEPALDMDSGKNGRITYSLASSGGRHSLFKVDTQTGVIVTAASLRSSAGDVFLFTLSATDSGVPSLTGYLQISLTVSQPNIHCPVFVGLPSSVDVREMAPLGTNVVRFSAIDRDGKASPNGIVKYSLDALASDPFKINSQSGLVTLSRSLAGESYILNVVASDLGQPQCHTRGKIDVNVISLNHAPQCIPGSLTTSIPYTTNASTALFTLKATDVDSGAAGRLSYTLTNFRSTSLSRNLFDVVTNDSTGADVILRSSPPKPSGPFNLATFSLAVRDQSSSPKSCTFRLTVTIADEFEFVSSKAVARLAEDARVQSVVPVTPRLSVRTTQLNASRISYSLYYAESLPFSIHAKTGVLSLSQSLDYEQQKEYNVNILAQTSEVPGAVTVATVRISVTNVNDNAPEFDQRQYAVFVGEQTKGGEMLLSLTATDSDVGSDRSQIEYQLVSVVPSESEDVFEIKRFAAGAVGIYLTDDAVLNYYVTDKYSVFIRALDTQNPSLSGQVTVLVFVNKTSAKRPLFDQEHYSTTLQENSPDGSSVLSVKALVDGKPSTNVMYSIRSQEFKSGSRANAFTITNSGVLQVANSVQLDYEKVREIAVVIVASLTQPVLRTSETIAVISLSDVNDNSPMFSKEVYTPSDVVVGLPRGFSVVNTSAIDADSGSNGEVTYSIEMTQEYFTIDSLTGEVSLAKELDSNADSSYELQVSAKDGGKPSLTGLATISITVHCSPTGQCRQISSDASKWIIIGSAAGGGVVLLLVIVIVVVVVVKRNSKHTKPTRYSDRTPSGLDVVNPAFNPENDMPSDEERVYEKIESGKAAAEENEYTEITSS